MYMVNGHARIRKDFLRVVHFYVYFWLKRGERILLSDCHYKRAIIGPPAKRHLNGVTWRANNDPTLNACSAGLSFSGDPDQYCYETLYYVISQGAGEVSGPPNPRDPRMARIFLNLHIFKERR